MNSDLPALLDEWASSLFRELDYVREARNGVRFKKLYGDLEVLLPLSVCFQTVHLLASSVSVCAVKAKLLSRMNNGLTRVDPLTGCPC